MVWLCLLCLGVKQREDGWGKSEVPSKGQEGLLEPSQNERGGSQYLTPFVSLLSFPKSSGFHVTQYKHCRSPLPPAKAPALCWYSCTWGCLLTLPCSGESLEIGLGKTSRLVWRGSSAQTPSPGQPLQDGAQSEVSVAAARRQPGWLLKDRFGPCSQVWGASGGPSASCHSLGHREDFRLHLPLLTIYPYLTFPAASSTPPSLSPCLDQALRHPLELLGCSRQLHWDLAPLHMHPVQIYSWGKSSRAASLSFMQDFMNTSTCSWASECDSTRGA